MKTKKELANLRRQAIASIPPEEKLMHECFGTFEERIQERIRELTEAK